MSSSGTDEVLRYDGTTGAFIDAFVQAGSGGLDGPSFLIFVEGAQGGGGGCSIALAGNTPSLPLFILIPLLIATKRVWQRNGRYSKR